MTNVTSLAVAVLSIPACALGTSPRSNLAAWQRARSSCLDRLVRARDEASRSDPVLGRGTASIVDDKDANPFYPEVVRFEVLVRPVPPAPESPYEGAEAYRVDVKADDGNAMSAETRRESVGPAQQPGWDDLIFTTGGHFRPALYIAKRTGALTATISAAKRADAARLSTFLRHFIPAAEECLRRAPARLPPAPDVALLARPLKLHAIPAPGISGPQLEGVELRLVSRRPRPIDLEVKGATLVFASKETQAIQVAGFERSNPYGGTIIATAVHLPEPEKEEGEIHVRLLPRVVARAEARQLRGLRLHLVVNGTARDIMAPVTVDE